MHLSPKHTQIVLGILAKYPYTFYVFGSRANGSPKPFSDLDLCIMEPIDYKTLSLIEGDFEESDFPYTVDIINWPKCTVEFQNLIRPNLELVQKRPTP